MAPFFGLVRQLQLGKSRFAMKMWLTRSYDKPYFNGNGIQSHEAVFHDLEGNKVHASVQHSAISNIKPLLEEVKIYAINNYVVVDNNFSFKTIQCPYKILIFKHTRVARVEDETLPLEIYNFKSFEEVSTMKDEQKYELFDVMGIVVSNYAPQVKQKDGKESKLMEIVLEDLENKTLSCTLWGTYADEMYAKISEINEGTVCAILQFCRATTIRGEVRITSSYDVTKIVFDDSVQEIKEMKDRYSIANKDRKFSLKILEAPVPRTIEDELNDGSSTLKMISELKKNEVS